MTELRTNFHCLAVIKTQECNSYSVYQPQVWAVRLAERYVESYYTLNLMGQVSETLKVQVGFDRLQAENKVEHPLQSSTDALAKRPPREGNRVSVSFRQK